MSVSFLNIEQELQKRWAYPYKWGRRQDNKFDKATNFIYKVNSFEQLLLTVDQEFNGNIKKNELFNYALNRWYNFKSANAVEAIFKTHPIVSETKNAKDKEKDFFIDDIPFDHKTTIFPKGCRLTFNEAVNQPAALIKWLYTNQSKDGRFHLKNRLFVVLYNSNGEHWKLKANLSEIEKAVSHYLNNFDIAQLIKLELKNGTTTCSDLIWILN